MSMSALDYILVRFGLKKDIGILAGTCNDKSGLTKGFNLHLLTRINRELCADFEIGKYQHFGVYNRALGAMESYIIVAVAVELVVYVATLERFSF
jgi:L-histidine N-alpha-methyltransferase